MVAVMVMVMVMDHGGDGHSDDGHGGGDGHSGGDGHGDGHGRCDGGEHFKIKLKFSSTPVSKTQRLD